MEPIIAKSSINAHIINTKLYEVYKIKPILSVFEGNSFSWIQETIVGKLFWDSGTPILSYASISNCRAVQI